MGDVWSWFSDLPPTVAAAAVAAAVSLLTLAMTTFVAPSIKYAFDTRLENRKLQLAFQSEQRKALKDHIARHKGPFLEAAESLSHRMWNYEQNAHRNWLDIRGRYSGDLRYYSKTFAYRFLLCLGAARLLERKAMFFDAQVAESTDFDFLKALKLNISVWTDTSLFKDLDYDDDQATDHFYKDDLISMADSFFTDEHVMTLAEFTVTVRQRRHPYVERYSKPQVIEKKNRPRAASYAPR